MRVTTHEFLPTQDLPTSPVETPAWRTIKDQKEYEKMVSVLS